MPKLCPKFPGVPQVLPPVLVKILKQTFRQAHALRSLELKSAMALVDAAFIPMVTKTHNTLDDFISITSTLAALCIIMAEGGFKETDDILSEVGVDPSDMN